MRINLKSSKLILTCRYDPVVIAAIKTITGRSWNVSAKHWEIPVEHVAECLTTLQPLGFIPTLEVIQAATTERAAFEQAEIIRTADPDILPATNLPLYHFQRTGAAFLRTLPNVLLADAPGLGKTLQVIAALENMPGPHLVFCPASLKYSWQEEIAKWTKDKVKVINGPKDKRIIQWAEGRAARFVIANYELLLFDYEDIKLNNWQAIICDEATRISNSTAKTTRALKSIPCRRRIALTGTPISNSPIDIFSIIDWLSPRYLGTLTQFKDKYCYLNDYFQVIGYRNLDKLKEQVSRFMLRRLKPEVLNDFPAKTTNNISFDLSDEEKELYEKVREGIVAELKELTIDRRSLSLIPVKMLRLKQLTDHPALISENGYSTKLMTLFDLIRPIVASGEKILIFTQFAEMLKILEVKLGEYQPLVIHGEVKAEERQFRVKQFTEDSAKKIMIMTEAGAYGLNLQAASTVIHFDLPWSVAKVEQREDRAHRIGQTKPVTVYNLLARETIDEYVAKVLHKKQKAAVKILDDQNRLEEAGISAADIKAILRI